MKTLRNFCLAVLIIGGLNWGLIGLFDFNLVGFLFDGFSNVISRVIYSLVGVASIVTLVTWMLPEHDEELYYKRSYE